jgi:cell wall-associated NlpC family hydrolase
VKKVAALIACIGILGAAASVPDTFASTFHLPPGVTLDRTIHPLAGTTASVQAKTNAVLKVAKSKYGTPYRWGHNEDRGQYGFDCSNFTEYVYHHALGYKFSTASRVQASSVGTQVPRSQMRPGDLLIFDYGHHVGIYAGNNQVIQEGGGLGKVGYLSIAPGKYWSNHITAVKRMY